MAEIVLKLAQHWHCGSYFGLCTVLVGGPVASTHRVISIHKFNGLPRLYYMLVCVSHFCAVVYATIHRQHPLHCCFHSTPVSIECTWCHSVSILLQLPQWDNWSLGVAELKDMSVGLVAREGDTGQVGCFRCYMPPTGRGPANNTIIVPSYFMTWVPLCEHLLMIAVVLLLATPMISELK